MNAAVPLTELDAPTQWEMRFRDARRFTESLCKPLKVEDYGVQSMPDASPAKWHLAHTTWFFETFVLEPFSVGYAPLNPRYRVLFNSYYDGVGEKHPRPERGMLTRPTVDEVYAYRRHVDAAVVALLHARTDAFAEIVDRVELGLHHERQHQELLLTDVQHAFSKNPLHPAYGTISKTASSPTPPLRFQDYEGGLKSIGFAGTSFAFDNEKPQHRVFIESFKLANRLVTQGEYLAFIRDGGYRTPELWLSDGYAFICEHDIHAPLYWNQRGEDGRYSLYGDIALDLDAPVCHVSYYEADAFARWANARLPTEAEWELAYASAPLTGQFAEEGSLIPRHDGSGFGSAWVWTASPYTAYPSFRAAKGALGEYNGKFMADQWVLRGGSCFTPRDSMRATYRNFFPAIARWQVSGIRLARD